MMNKFEIDYLMVTIFSILGVLFLMEYFENDYPILKQRGEYIISIFLIPVGALAGLALGRTHGFIRAIFPSIFSDIFTVAVVAVIFSYTNFDDSLSIFRTVCFIIPFVWGFALRGWVFSTPFFSKILGTKEEQFIGEDNEEDKKSKWVLVAVIVIFILFDIYM